MKNLLDIIGEILFIYRNYLLIATLIILNILYSNKTLLLASFILGSILSVDYSNFAQL